ncbi:MAG: flagellar biosynthesis repressor FlbT [Ancalomicrobiaceae bacterium]|nr:flagellar biosynthesis repressor FlbT [Ancalomicrobiaceae bacterium]
MALSLELKPGEKVIIGDSIVTNDNQRIRIFVEGHAPVLREKDIMTLDTATTPAKRIYLTVQLMFLGGDIDELRKNYLAFVSDIIAASPSSTPIIIKISEQIISENYYRAMKEARKLIEYEDMLARHLASSRAAEAANAAAGLADPAADPGKPSA